MSVVYFITHTNTVIDPKKNVSQWKLSKTGIKRVKKSLNHNWLKTIKAIYSSPELKARLTAKEYGNYLHLPVNIFENLKEIDRSSTGFLKPDKFWAQWDRFLLNPKKSINGWEIAESAQIRIVKAIEEIYTKTLDNKKVIVVSHGALGSLLNWHIKGLEIKKQKYELGKDGGYYFVFDPKKWAIIQDWKPIDKY